MKRWDAKLTNPKDMIGSDKLPMHVVPSTVTAYTALAFLEGALKYGQFNWRVAGVRFSIYASALERHLAKLKNGEWADPVTKVPHLASIIACAGILIDAKVCGKLNDDRPPAAPVGELIDGLSGTVVHLKHLFREHDPFQPTLEFPCPVATTRNTSKRTKKRPSKSKSGKRATKRGTSSKKQGRSTRATA